MHQSAQATGQTVADIAQGIGAAQLAKEHGDELCPARKTLGGSFRVVLFN
jgi:alkyl hydroperoxide reductase subunit AhpC